MANPWLTKYNKLSYKHEQTNLFWTHDKIAGDIYEEHFSKFLKANSCTHIKLSQKVSKMLVFPLFDSIITDQRTDRRTDGQSLL